MLNQTMIKKIVITFSALHIIFIAVSQDILPNENQLMSNSKNDTVSLLQAFTSGRFAGHFRYFFMATDNKKGLTDYYANAAGGEIKYEILKFHNFKFAIAGSYIINIGSSNLSKPDTLTGQNNRYEIGLFDITAPSKKRDLILLQEFNVGYQFKNSFIRIGRQLINGAFINLQDGRMRPTAVNGIWAELNAIKKLHIQLGWVWAISPRSTTSWYKPGESIGVFSTGVNPDGSKSGYYNNVKSNGIALIQVDIAIAQNIKIKAENMFVENIFNTSMFQMDYSIPLKNGRLLFFSMQTVQQFAMNDGGNSDQAKTYFAKGTNALTFGTRLGWKNKKWEIALNYNRITSLSRYLSPREWGLEPFLTNLPRERNEGLGDVHAFMGKLTYDMPKQRIKTVLAAGYYKLPGVKNYALNKYGLPSYTQINADIRYTFAHMLKGLDAQFLVVWKSKDGETYNNNKFVINKVDMLQYNFVLNYHF